MKERERVWKNKVAKREPESTVSLSLFHFLAGFNPFTSSFFPLVSSLTLHFHDQKFSSPFKTGKSSNNPFLMREVPSHQNPFFRVPRLVPFFPFLFHPSHPSISMTFTSFLFNKRGKGERVVISHSTLPLFLSLFSPSDFFFLL